MQYQTRVKKCNTKPEFKKLCDYVSPNTTSNLSFLVWWFFFKLFDHIDCEILVFKSDILGVAPRQPSSFESSQLKKKIYYEFLIDKFLWQAKWYF